MQRYTTIALFSAIVLSVSILGVYGFTSVPSTLKVQSDTQNIGAVPLLGHVTLTVTDPQGNILTYHQGDNIVVNQAEDCLSKKIFGIASNICPTGGAVYSVIGLGNQTSPPAVAKTDTALDHEITNQAGLTRLAASTLTETDATSGAPVSDVLQAQFTDSSSSAATITEAGLFNSTAISAVGMFAHQTFSGVTLNSGDSLTVKWTVTMGT
ncbi:hypothetical protein DYY67_1484 [Candidatus Nitrosotalea sp. TS]|uniref:hypothetical protein n=1 Tax=Candidatus Nitrosotalea sp. TS TaxID=2341020 RepID=UPI00140D1E78|nr:hypothetical protein [Candidatus Nitrosotalea sp. TS]NHI04109.1 hypothetical protein [Candidatus Nitrosotalea sp. TS]